jgi:hypothetical protein
VTADPQRVIGWTRLAQERAPLAWHRHVVSASFYRAGDYEKALRSLCNSLKQSWALGGPLDQFVIAMIPRRMRHAGRGLAFIEESIRWDDEMESRRVDEAVPRASGRIE